ncbi:MAG: YihY/virulence factor BrkB family protein [Cyanobacteriota bacterium]
MKPKVILGLLKEAFQEWQDDKASRLAAALAYYTVFSLAPLVIIAIAIAGAVFGEEAARGEIERQIQGLVGSAGAEVIQTAIENANRPDANGGIASFISVVVLLFGASGVFAELQDSLNTIWEVQPKPGRGIKGFISKRILSFSMVLGIGFLLMVSLIVSAGLSALSTYMSHLIPGVGWLWEILNFVISFGVITLLFGLMYKFLPDVKITWNDVLIGAIITALLFTIGKTVLGMYLGQNFGSTYGAAGSLVVLLAWVYYSAQILFFGAELTQVYASRYGSRIVPNEDAEFVTEEARANQGLRRKRQRTKSDRF